MRRIRQIFSWTLLLNKRFLKQPLFLILLALVPLLVLGIGSLSDESSSLVNVAISTGNGENETAQELVESLAKGSNAAIRYIPCEDEAAVKEMVSSGKARMGLVFPDDMDALFAAYGAQETQDLSAGALALLGSVLGEGSGTMKDHPIRAYTATNDVVAKLSREQLFGKLYPELSRSVLKVWLKRHPEIGSMTADERDQFVDDTLESFGTDYNYFDLEYLDGTKVTDEEIDRYLFSPIRGLLAALIMLTGMAAVLHLSQDCSRRLFVWLPSRLQPVFHFGYLLIPLADLALASIAALLISGSFTKPLVEILSLVLLVLQTAGFSNLLRILLRRRNLLASAIPILLCACLFLTPVFVDLTIFEPVQILLPPYLYLKSIHGSMPMWPMAVYAAVCTVLSLLLDAVIPPSES